MWINKVKAYMACATFSALREANNGEEVVANIKAKTGIDIRYRRKREAEIIATTNIFESINKNRTFLYIDVGGEVPEFSVLVKGAWSQSFKVGTVRMINNMVSDKVWDEIKALDRRTHPQPQLALLVQEGRSINYLRSQNKRRPSVEFYCLNSLHTPFSVLDYNERVSYLSLISTCSDEYSRKFTHTIME